MKIRLYLDEDAMEKALVKALQTQGIDVTSALTEQRLGDEDEHQLLYSIEQQRVVYTFNNKHFTVLHTAFIERGQSHAGIIVAQKDLYSVGEQMRRLARLVNTLSAEEMQDRLEYLSAWV